MTDILEYSYRGAKEMLAEKGVIEELHLMPDVWTKYAMHRDYSKFSRAMERLGGWQTEVQVDLGPDDSAHHEKLTPFLDAYHPEHHVAIEHESKEQMRARWHLMKIQAAHERPSTLPIDVAVLIFPTNRDPSLRRTRRELEGPFFTDHFPIHLPVYAIEYSMDD